MAKVFIEETTLTAIGDAIRGKEGTTELVPVNDMATRITSLPSGGGGNEPTAEDLTFTGNCNFLFAYQWKWVLEKYANKISFKDVTSLQSAFSSYPYEEIPATINVANLTSMTNAFNYSKLKVSPKIRGTIKWATSTDLSSVFTGCNELRDVEDLFTPEMIEGYSTVKVTSQYSCPRRCALPQLSLRRIPSWWYKFRLNPESTAYPSSSDSIYANLLYNLYVVDEITNIPVWKCAAPSTINLFGSSSGNCYRLKNLTFETNADGSPIVTEWKNQTISLASNVGYEYTSVNNVSNIESNRQQYLRSSNILKYNSGITADKFVYDDATYQALKDDPDWWSCISGSSTAGSPYSRYNHDSAVATINSLPDTSAYLATAGGTNTIKFKGDAGSKTDGGAINTLTAEEIAVATAKGWTVTLV